MVTAPNGGGCVPALSRGVQSGPAAVLRLGVLRADQAQILGQQSAQFVGVAFFARFEERGDVPCFPLLNFSFQGPPTREAVVSRNREQNIGKLRLGIDPPQFLQSILRQLP